MYRIYCDETWTSQTANVKQAYYVFYDVMVEESIESQFIEKIDAFRERRGLLKKDGSSIEVKW